MDSTNRLRDSTPRRPSRRNGAEEKAGRHFGRNDTGGRSRPRARRCSRPVVFLFERSAGPVRMRHSNTQSIPDRIRILANNSCILVIVVLDFPEFGSRSLFIPLFSRFERPNRKRIAAARVFSAGWGPHLHAERIEVTLRRTPGGQSHWQPLKAAFRDSSPAKSTLAPVAPVTRLECALTRWRPTTLAE